MQRLVMLLLLLTSGVRGAQVLRVDITGEIHPVTVEILSSALAEAQRSQSRAVLIRLDTPGGLMDATREVIQVMASAPVPVIAYVGPSGARAASAGFFLLLGADAAAMAPGTRTGAASPVLLGQQMDPVMRKKVESDASAWMRSLASRRGRNPELAEKTITEAKSFTEDEALRAGLIDLTAANEADLLAKLHGREITLFNGTRHTLELQNADIRGYEPALRLRFIRAIADPNIAFLLLILGALGLYFEFTVPGAIFPGVLGAISILLGMTAMSALPINWLGVALLLLAVGLLAAEAFVTSHGVLGIGGAVALVLGALLLVDGPPGVRISLGTALAAGLPFAGIAAFLGTLVVRAQQSRAATGESGMIGETGTARTPLDPSGKVFVRGEYWDATSPVAVPAGTVVKVLAVEGLRLRVEPVTAAKELAHD